MLLDFGVIFGTLLIIFLVVMILRIILQKDKNPMIILFSAVVLSAIIKLLFSGSVWNEMDTYLCIGLGMGCFSNKMYKGFAYQKIND